MTAASQFDTPRLEPGDLLTPDELAARLKVPVSWVYDHVRERAVSRLPGFKLGKYWRFRESDVIEWLQKQSRPR